MKKLFAIGAFFAVALSAHASYFYWQVGSEAGDDMSKVTAYASEIGENWDVAKFYQVDGDTKTLKGTLTGIEQEAGPNTENPTDLGLSKSAVESSSYTYYIELVNSTSGALVGYKTGTYASLAGSVYDELPTPGTMPTVWHGGTYNAPEPTSALLMLLGVAGLALKRKQRKA